MLLWYVMWIIRFAVSTNKALLNQARFVSGQFQSIKYKNIIALRTNIIHNEINFANSLQPWLGCCVRTQQSKVVFSCDQLHVNTSPTLRQVCMCIWIVTSHTVYKEHKEFHKQSLAQTEPVKFEMLNANLNTTWPFFFLKLQSNLKVRSQILKELHTCCHFPQFNNLNTTKSQ